MERKLTLPTIATRTAALLLALIAYHTLLRACMDHGGLRLGAVSAKLAPLYAYWHPHVKGWLLLPLAVLAGYLCSLRRTRVAASLTDAGAVAFFQLWFLAIATSVATLDGAHAIVAPLERVDLEYYGAVDQVQGVAEFLRDAHRLAPALPMHARVHPPGAVLFVWAFAQLLGPGPWGAALGIIGFSSLGVPLVYVWGRALGGPGVARRAAALFALTPSVVLFSATSMDGPFAVVLIATMLAFWQALRNRPIWFGLAAGLAASLAALMTYSVAVALLFCALAAALELLAGGVARTRALKATAAALVGFLGSHLALWLATGYRPLTMFLVAVHNSNSIMHGTRHESAVRYAHIIVGNLAVFCIAAGLASTAIWWPTLVSVCNRWIRGSRDQLLLAGDTSVGSTAPHEPPSPSNPALLDRFLVAGALALIVAAVVPVYVLEVERVWLFLTPLVTIPVAARLFNQERGTGRVAATLATALLLAAQTLVTEVLLSTYW